MFEFHMRREFIGYLSLLLASQEGLCCM